MDHVVYLDNKSQELAKLLVGSKTMIVRGSMGKKAPYGRVFAQDTLYFITCGSGQVVARGSVRSVLQTPQLCPEETQQILLDHQRQLMLSPVQFQRWANKAYLVLVEVEDVNMVSPFALDRTGFNPLDDWLMVGEIESATAERVMNESLWMDEALVG
ncbi:MAG: hypothetical protein ABFD44_07055 [Anaerolineaceae bacterium]